MGALLDAGVAMRATALSVAGGVHFGGGAVGTGAAAIGNGQGEGAAVLLLDPAEQEERDCDAIVTVSVDGSREQLISSLSAGAALDAVTWASCIEAGGKACKVLESFLRMSLQKRLETLLRPSQ